jgi:hypothetical protein
VPDSQQGVRGAGDETPSDVSQHPIWEPSAVLDEVATHLEWLKLLAEDGLSKPRAAYAKEYRQTLALCHELLKASDLAKRVSDLEARLAEVEREEDDGLDDVVPPALAEVK